MKRLFLLSIFFFMTTSVHSSDPKLTSAYEQELIQRVKGVFGSGDQEQKIADSARPVCATPIFLELFANYDRLSMEAKKILSAFIRQRPDSFWTDPRTYDSQSGNFKIHYVVSGKDAVFESDVDTLPEDTHPDYVNRCAEIMDYVWEHVTDTLDYNQPLLDGWYFPSWDNGGDGKYDVYLTYQEPGYLGFTFPEWYYPYPKATSYIVLRSDYSIYTQSPYYSYEDQYDGMKVTAAHEFFHAVQMGYDADEYGGGPYPNSKPYWMEMTATWMEDMVYDYVNDYLGYISYFFRYPWLSLKTFSYNQADGPKYYHAYGSCVWPIYLSERFGGDIIREIWTECGETAGDNVLLATGQILADKGSSFDQAFQEFTIWNYFTSSKADTQTFYSEGHLFPPAYVYSLQNHPSYPVDVNSVIYPPENLGSNYVVFQVPPGSTGGLNVGFYGDSLGGWEVSLIGYESGNPPRLSHVELDGMQNGTTDVYNWNQYSKIVMIPAVTIQYDDDTFNYAYTASIDTALDVEEENDQRFASLIRLFQNYPNPFNSITVIPFTVHRSPLTENGPIPTTLIIYNVLGQKIRTLVDEEKTAGTHEVSWDGKDRNRVEVASGIYFYRIKAGQYSEVKKMLLVK